MYLVTLVTLNEEDRVPQQRVTHIVVDPNSVDFMLDLGKNLAGGVPCIIAPLSCIESLIEEIEKGEKEGIVDCQGQHPFANYLGAKIRGEVVELNYDERGTEVETLSVKSLLKIKKAVKRSLAP